MMNPAPASDASVKPTSWWLVANAARHDTNSTRVTPITTSPGMILLSFIDSPACGRVVLSVVDGILRALHRYSSLGIPTPAQNGLISTVDLPDAVVRETVTETKVTGGRILSPTTPRPSETPVSRGRRGHPPNTAGPARAGMLIVSTNSISVSRNQPAPCQAHHVSWFRHV